MRDRLSRPRGGRRGRSDACAKRDDLKLPVVLQVDRAGERRQLGIDAGFLADLAMGSLLERLVAVDPALREHPVTLLAAMDDREDAAVVRPAAQEPTGGVLCRRDAWLR